MPLKLEDFSKNGLQQFPMLLGGVVPIVNLAGIVSGQLKLDGKTVAGMYDPTIVAPYPGTTLSIITRRNQRGNRADLPALLPTKSSHVRSAEGGSTNRPAALGARESAMLPSRRFLFTGDEQA
jgi:ABC-type phosphate transport system substrate-binding protein